MPRPPLEVADVIAALSDSAGYISGLTASSIQKRVLHKLSACRTAALGGHLDQCDNCEHRTIAYNSCRNRHCPKCQAANRARWFEDRKRDLIPTAYFHVVFTIPAELGPLALQNKKTLYSILFRAASETLAQIAADPKHLGAKIGFVAVLHTWGQTLMHHPHLHCVVPGGGLGDDGKRWISSRAGYFVSVKVLSRMFRGKFLDYLGRAYKSGELTFRASLEDLAAPQHFGSLLNSLWAKPWVVYAKPPMGGPSQVLAYLARYTHRVAIANSRISSLEDGRVSFRYKDYAKGGRNRIMSLNTSEFLRRFLMHVLPDHFVRIRHYGLLANRCRRTNVARARELIGVATDPGNREADVRAQDSHQAWRHCPQCTIGTMITVDRFTAAQALNRGPPACLSQS